MGYIISRLDKLNEAHKELSDIIATEKSRRVYTFKCLLDKIKDELNCWNEERIQEIAEMEYDEEYIFYESKNMNEILREYECIAPLISTIEKRV